MDHRTDCLVPSVLPTTPRPAPAWERPTYEVITLDCEITSYAPDGDGPLF
jgi:hypothetical protein